MKVKRLVVKTFTKKIVSKDPLVKTFVWPSRGLISGESVWDHMFNPCRPFGGSWNQIWPTGALRGPPNSPKGTFGGEMSPFGGCRGQKLFGKILFVHTTSDMIGLAQC